MKCIIYLCWDLLRSENLESKTRGCEAAKSRATVFLRIGSRNWEVEGW